jgi:2-dehydro-3-deoxygluconokinase
MIVSFGELLLRLSTMQAQRFQQAKAFEVTYGGSEANITSALALWGIPSAHVTVLPDNEIGEAASQLMRSYGLNTSFFRSGTGRMGIYFLEHGTSLRSPKVIYDRFNSAFSNLSKGEFDWDVILKGAKWFHWSGITPAVSQSAADACKEAIQTAKRMGITVSADINYRRVLWQYGMRPIDVMPELISMSDVIVGGITDFENCMGIKLAPDQSFEQACEKVKSQFPHIKTMANTFRVTHTSSHNELQGILWNGQDAEKTKNYFINPITDRIGSGDAFMAGLIYQSLKGAPNRQIIEFATAAAAYKHTIPGDVLVAPVEEIENCMNEQNIGKLLR